MGRAPCCDKANVKKGPWSPEEDTKLKEFIEKYGTGGNWIALPHKAGLKRCGKSCRLRWLNYLRPNLKHGEFSADEDRIICGLFASIGSRWSIIAAQLPGRTDNDIKNYWNTKLKKKLLGISPSQRKPHHQQQQQQQQQHLFFSASFDGTTAPSFSSSQTSCYTTTHPTPLHAAGFEGFPVSSQDVSTLLHGPTQQYQMKPSGSLLMFGGDQQSCSSSDGSCTQISYGKEIDYQDCIVGSAREQLSFENYLYGASVQENQKQPLGIVGGGHMEKGSNGGIWGNAPLEYGLEEIKQLLSFNNGCNNNLYGGEESRESMYYH